MTEIETGDAFIDEISATHDAFRLAIRGHQGISDILAVALGEVLDSELVGELSRLRFPLRVELGVALGVVPREYRATLLVLNRLRNRLAHERAAAFGPDEVGHVLASLPARVADHLRSEIDIPKKPTTMLATTTIIIFQTIQRAIADHRDAAVTIELATRLARAQERGEDPARLVAGGGSIVEYEKRLLRESRVKRAADGRL